MHFKCTKCGRDGHTSDRCWGVDVNGKRPPPPPGYVSKYTLKSNRGGGEVEDKNEKANNAKVVAFDHEYTCLMSVVNKTSSQSGVSRWIIDSGGTSHMTFDRSLFLNYENVSGIDV